MERSSRARPSSRPMAPGPALGKREALQHRGHVELPALGRRGRRLAEDLAVAGAEQSRLAPTGEPEPVRRRRSAGSRACRDARSRRRKRCCFLSWGSSGAGFRPSSLNRIVSARERDLQRPRTAPLGQAGVVAGERDHAGHAVLLDPRLTVGVGREDDPLRALAGERGDHVRGLRPLHLGADRHAGRAPAAASASSRLASAPPTKSAGTLKIVPACGSPYPRTCLRGTSKVKTTPAAPACSRRAAPGGASVRNGRVVGPARAREIGRHVDADDRADRGVRQRPIGKSRTTTLPAAFAAVISWSGPR